MAKPMKGSGWMADQMVEDHILFLMDPHMRANLLKGPRVGKENTHLKTVQSILEISKMVTSMGKGA